MADKIKLPPVFDPELGKIDPNDEQKTEEQIKEVEKEPENKPKK